MLKAECLVKGFHSVWSHNSTWYDFPGFSLTPVVVASLLIPPKNESVLSRWTFQISSGLFSRGLKQMAHDETVLFLAMILGKKNTSFCLVIINQSGTCAHTERSRSFVCFHYSFVQALNDSSKSFTQNLFESWRLLYIPPQKQSVILSELTGKRAQEHFEVYCQSFKAQWIFKVMR